MVVMIIGSFCAFGVESKVLNQSLTSMGIAMNHLEKNNYLQISSLFIQRVKVILLTQPLFIYGLDPSSGHN